uniref:Pancreatic trypsin inhibitor n=1 Tax=Rhipicephalus zambeziensis TaxID=60191 RepID=A0A224YD35_9ACAR
MRLIKIFQSNSLSHTMARLIFLVVLCLLLVSATCSPARRTVLRWTSPWKTKVIQPRNIPALSENPKQVGPLPDNEEDVKDVPSREH